MLKNMSTNNNYYYIWAIFGIIILHHNMHNEYSNDKHFRFKIQTAENNTLEQVIRI